MKIILTLLNEEGNRQIEDEDENIRPAHALITRELENVLGKHQIRYQDIAVSPNDEE